MSGKNFTSPAEHAALGNLVVELHAIPHPHMQGGFVRGNSAFERYACMLSGKIYNSEELRSAQNQRDNEIGAQFTVRSTHREFPPPNVARVFALGAILYVYQRTVRYGVARCVNMLGSNS